MTLSRSVLLVAMTVFVANAWGQSNKREPHIGYLYPAGAQQGTTVQILAGGQSLNGASNVYVSGEGVHASVIQYAKPLNNKELQELRRQVTQLIKQRQQGPPSWTGKGLQPLVSCLVVRPANLMSLGQDRVPPPAKNKKAAQDADKPDAATESAPLPDHPLLRNLDKMSLRELQHWSAQFTKARMQPNPQIAEMVVIEVAIDADVPPGDRVLRIGTAAGLTNPLRFEVGALPEVSEQEPNDQINGDSHLFHADSSYSSSQMNEIGDCPHLFDLPVLLNGQILPGDVDRFRFRARQGQKLVMAVQARRLIPYLADAVPGWFQATLALYDSKGKEVAFADDYRFDPDPVLFYEVPKDGEYVLEIRDSIYRGREDFVYRIAVGEQPFITHMFPLGGCVGEKAVASIDGWNLPEKRLRLDTLPGEDCIRHATLSGNGWTSNRVSYAVDTLPECDEREPNDSPKHAQRMALPRIVNGRIGQPGDVDVFRFKGRTGDEVVAEVYARRLNSPLDSLLRLTDTSGRVLEWNDDHEDKEAGLLTHQADSCLRARVPEDGVYYVYLSDSQNHGEDDYAYRLRLGPPRPDFAILATPSSVSVPAGRSAVLCMHAIRKDGFDGDIELALKKPSVSFALDGGRIPKGRDSIRVTLTAREPLEQPVALQLEGRAQIGAETVIRPVVPAEDMMQAFAYRHLVPSQELMAAVTGAKRRGAGVELAGDTPIRIPVGGTAQVQVKTPKGPMRQDINLELSDPPKGVTLQDVSVAPGLLTLVLKADPDVVKAGLTDNLIVEAFIEPAGRQQDGKTAKQKQRVSLGVLPAIPFEIVQR